MIIIYMYFEDINVTANIIPPVYQRVIGFISYGRKDKRNQTNIWGLGDFILFSTDILIINNLLSVYLIYLLAINDECVPTK